MAVEGTRVICRTRGGIPTPARGVRTHSGARATQNVAGVNTVNNISVSTVRRNTLIHQQRTGFSVSLVQSGIMKRVAAALVFVIYVTVRPAYHDLTMQQHEETV